MCTSHWLGARACAFLLSSKRLLHLSALSAFNNTVTGTRYWQCTERMLELHMTQWVVVSALHVMVMEYVCTTHMVAAGWPWKSGKFMLFFNLFQIRQIWQFSFWISCWVMGGCIFNTLLASSVHDWLWWVVIMFLERQLQREREREREREEESMWSRSTLPHLMVWDTIDFILFGCENRISEMESPFHN